MTDFKDFEAKFHDDRILMLCYAIPAPDALWQAERLGSGAALRALREGYFLAPKARALEYSGALAAVQRTLAAGKTPDPCASPVACPVILHDPGAALSLLEDLDWHAARVPATVYTFELRSGSGIFCIGCECPADWEADDVVPIRVNPGVFGGLTEAREDVEPGWKPGEVTE